MKFLFDTNVIIPAEPTSPENVEPGTRVAAELLGLIAQAEHQAYVHPASLNELQGDKDEARRELRSHLVAKYPVLPSPPEESDAVKSAFGDRPPASHDQIDHLLLSAVLADAVDYLVSDDRGVQKKAIQLGIAERVLSLADAVAAVRGLFETVPSPPPSVNFTVCHDLDTRDPIFDSFRREYDGFDRWIKKCKLEHRKVWIVRAPGGECAGICIIKREDPGEYGFADPVLKICSFKISDQFRGYRYGELMLKAVFNYAAANAVVTVYVTVFSKHEHLLALFEMFGFELLDQRSDLGEIVLAKRTVCSRAEYLELSPLEVHVRFGPPLLKIDGARVFVVPIRPNFHSLLFPELEKQTSLFHGSQAFGNSIMKAYLCRSRTRQVIAGSALLFYQSASTKSVATVGVVEKTLVSRSPDEVARFVGKRTVYPYVEIEEMCEKGEVLAILFRQAQVFDPTHNLRTLVSEGVLKGPPQSIVSVREKGVIWLTGQIEASR